MLVAAGVIAGGSEDQPTLLTAILVCFWAVLAGDTTLYWIARRVGGPILERPMFRKIATPERREKVRKQFEERGSATIFFARHVAGLRALVFILAGIEKMPYRKFIAWDALGALVSVPVVCSLGYFFRSNLDKVEEWLSQAHNVILLLAVTALGIWLYRRWKAKRAEDAERSGSAATSSLEDGE